MHTESSATTVHVSTRHKAQRAVSESRQTSQSLMSVEEQEKNGQENISETYSSLSNQEWF